MSEILGLLRHRTTWARARAPIARGEFFAELRQLVQDRADLAGDIEYWDTWLREEHAGSFASPELRNLCSKVRAMLILAAEAIRRQETVDSVDQATNLRELAKREDLAPLVQATGPAWLAGCLHFLKAADTPSRRLDIPVAYVHNGVGALAVLRLEPVDGLIGAFQHPQDFHTCIERDFHAAMHRAREAALRLMDDPTAVLPAGCWRLLDSEGRPLTGMGGNSAGGAAALGWFHLHRGTRPDRETIVLAAIAEDGTLATVDGIAEKILAVARDGRFDTAVVATPEDRAAALAALAQYHIAPEALDVVVPERLAGW